MSLSAVRLHAHSDRVIAALALVVLVVAGLAIYGSQGAAPTPYTSASAAPNGTLALYRWVAALGYNPLRLTISPLRLRGLRALVVLEPQAAFSTAETATLVRWVRGGGTLVLLEDGGDATLPGAFGLAVRSLPAPSPFSLAGAPAPYGAAPVQPLLAHPPLRGLRGVVSSAVYGSAPGVVPVLGTGGLPAPGAAPNTHVGAPDADNPALVYEVAGQGRVYAGTMPDALTNGSIAAGDNRRLVPNVLAGLPPGSGVGFDEYHLVVPAPAVATLGDALVGTSWGRALLYAVILAFGYVALTGRRLGRPLRAVPERGRSLAEYVISMAAIFRRAGLRARVLALWQDDLRRNLAGTGGVRGRADSDLVAEAARRVGLTPQEQNEALLLLQPRPALGEGTLVELCSRIARLQGRLV